MNHDMPGTAGYGKLQERLLVIQIMLRNGDVRQDEVRRAADELRALYESGQYPVDFGMSIYHLLALCLEVADPAAHTGDDSLPCQLRLAALSLSSYKLPEALAYGQLRAAVLHMHLARGEKQYATLCNTNPLTREEVDQIARLYSDKEARPHNRSIEPRDRR